MVVKRIVEKIIDDIDFRLWFIEMAKKVSYIFKCGKCSYRVNLKCHCIKSSYFNIVIPEYQLSCRLYDVSVKKLDEIIKRK